MYPTLTYLTARCFRSHQDEDPMHWGVFPRIRKNVQWTDLVQITKTLTRGFFYWSLVHWAGPYYSLWCTFHEAAFPSLIVRVSSGPISSSSCSKDKWSSHCRNDRAGGTLYACVGQWNPLWSTLMLKFYLQELLAQVTGLGIRTHHLTWTGWAEILSSEPKSEIDLNIFYFIYMKRDWAEHRCYVKALSWQ